MDQPWSAPYIQKLDVEPGTAHAANLNKLFHFAEENDVPFLRDQLQQVTQLLYSHPRMSCMPTLWYQRAQILSLLRFPDLALGDAYKAYLLLTGVGPLKCSKPQDEIPENSSRLPTFTHSQPDEEGQPFQISQAGIPREVRIYPHRFKAEVKATICKNLLIAGCLQDCISLLIADPWPEDMREDILLLSTCATKAKLDEFRYHSSHGLDADEIEEALNFGSVYALPLPWVDPGSSQRSFVVRESIAIELQILSGYTCVLDDLPSSVPRSDNHDCNGLFADVDLPPDHIILSQETSLVATSAKDPRCGSCCQSLSKKQDQRGETCCNLMFCSPGCQARANHLFHDASNCHLMTKTSDEASLAVITSSALQPESDSNRVTRLLLNRLLQLLAKEFQDHDTPPLEHRDVQTLHARLSASKPVTLSFANDIQRPIHHLQSLGIDVFANPHFDTWVILDIIRRMKINQWDHEELGHLERSRSKPKRGQEVLWSGLTPGISLLNHSCRPNVKWKKDDKTSKMTITTSREVAKGEELTISYLLPQLLTDDVHERQKQLADWFSRCRCDWCSEQFALSEAQSKSAAEDKTDLVGSFEDLTTQYEPSLIEQWFGSTLPVVKHKPHVDMKTDIDPKPDRGATPPNRTEVEPASSPDVPLSVGRLCSGPTRQERAESVDNPKDKMDTDESSLFVRADDNQHNEVSAAPGHQEVEGGLMNNEGPATSQAISTTSVLPRGAPTKTPMSSQVSQAVSLEPSATPGSPPAFPYQPDPAHRGNQRSSLKRARSGSPSNTMQGRATARPQSTTKLKLSFKRGSDMADAASISGKLAVPASIIDAKFAASRPETEPLIIDLTYSEPSHSQRTSIAEETNTRESAKEVIRNWQVLRRPQQSGMWWSVTEAQWREMRHNSRIKWSHIGRLMETDAGVVLSRAERCDHCRTADIDCIVYGEEVKAAFQSTRRSAPPSCCQCIRYNRRCQFPHIDPNRNNPNRISLGDKDRRRTDNRPRSQEEKPPSSHLKPQVSARHPLLDRPLEDTYKRLSSLDRPLEDRYSRAAGMNSSRTTETTADRARDERHSDLYASSKRQKVTSHSSWRHFDDLERPSVVVQRPPLRYDDDDDRDILSIQEKRYPRGHWNFTP